VVIRYHPGRHGPIRPTASGLNLLPVGTAGALPQAIAIAAGRWLGAGPLALLYREIGADAADDDGRGAP
jgi:hypothetical protein